MDADIPWRPGGAPAFDEARRGFRLRRVVLNDAACRNVGVPKENVGANPSFNRGQGHERE